ncbi:MAG: prolipoprotein diacylglyceryl transferase [Actinobacteria bacterium]|nr:prolipoprotein diacylglyceryl transferase [Actinomycetota bacterium]
MQFLASIPSPSTNSIGVGPLNFRAYGVCIAIGVLAAVWLAQRRMAQRGQDPEVVTSLAMWGVPFGVVGGRLYHVITDNQRFRGDWLEAFKIWEGGLGIWGAVAGGVLGGLIAAKRANVDVSEVFYAIAPAIPLAQAIGRVGNWFNQELFGRPSGLPWALEIDQARRPPGFVDSPAFHPTFLYEALWNLGVVVLIIWVVPKVLPRLRLGYEFAAYVGLYTVGRLWIELLRIDTANKILGQRINVWTSLIVGAVAFAFVWSNRNGGRRQGGEAEPGTRSASSSTANSN